MGKRWLGLLLTLVLWWGQIAGAWALTEDQKVVLQAWRLVNQSYVDEGFNHHNWWQVRDRLMRKPLRNREEAYQAIEGMLAKLNDPFTRLLRPEQYRSLQVNTSGELSGVGLQINLDPASGYVEVIAPLEGSPAAAAGIASRDLIVAIDGVDTSTLALDEAAARMRGPQGTQVELSVRSPQTETASLRKVTLTRDRVNLNPVSFRLVEQGGKKLGYVRLSQFSANAPEELETAVQKLEKQGAQGYVLDLRNNPGGLLTAGVAIAQQWLDSGAIVYTVNRQGVLGSYEATESTLTPDPLVVLVNGATASASEILAGALQDRGRAQLLGEKTFGKGLIQSLFELPDGAGIAVTVARYETPNHRDINKLGIQPDFPMPQEPIAYGDLATEQDGQYQAALAQLLKKLS